MTTRPCKHGWINSGAPGDLCDSCVYEEGYAAGIEAAAKRVSGFRFFSGSGADLAEYIRKDLLSSEQTAENLPSSEHLSKNPRTEDD